MIRVPAPEAVSSPALADGFGLRVRGIDPDDGDEVELLELAPELVEHDGFVTALGDRVARVSSVRHASYVHLRRLDRPAADRLSLISDYTPGWRLSDLLRVSAETNTVLETTVVIGLLRQLLPAVALFSRHNRDSAIGALAPERLIVTPQARMVIPEHAFGSALEKLNLGRERCWREFRIAMPPSAGLPRANARADTNALGVVALSLVLGRLLDQSEYPAAMEGLIESATETRKGESSPLSTPFAQWISRALQIEVRTAFQTPHEAQVAFEAVLASNRGYVTAPTPLERWVNEIGALIDAANAPPAPPPEPPSPEALLTERPLPAFVTQMPMMMLDVPAPDHVEPMASIEPVELAEAPEPSVLDEDWAPQQPAHWASEPLHAPEVADAPPVIDAPPTIEVLDVPEAPATEEPQASDALAAAEAPAALDAPDAQDAPAALDALDAPAALDEPDAPSALDAPVEPDAPAAPDAPDAPDAPAAPSLFQTFGLPPDAPALPVLPALFRAPLVMGLIAVVVLMASVLAWLLTRPSAASLTGDGELIVQSRPPARVSIDGKDRGLTPQTLRLSAGAHVLEVQIGKTEPRVIPLAIRAGVQTSQYIELQNVPMTGELDLRSDPAGARVLVDGQPRGTTPGVIKDLSPGDHEVALELSGRKVKQVVRIEAGVTAQLALPIPKK